MDLLEIRDKATDCTNCRLCEGRKNVVFGEGDENADLMFIGEAPTLYDDNLGLPFMDDAGNLLNLMIAAMGLKRQDIYITTLVKCAPLRGRTPRADEVKACISWLRKQVSHIKPKIIVCLGSLAAQYIMEPDARISQVHGQILHRNDYIITGTYHPKALIRDPELKIATWKDLRMVRDLLKGKNDESS